jgi:hypothetical protein
MFLKVFVNNDFSMVSCIILFFSLIDFEFHFVLKLIVFG